LEYVSVCAHENTKILYICAGLVIFFTYNCITGPRFISKLKVRIKDIAEQAGVSTGTVDRVIHKRGEVSLKTRKKVIGIMNELQYEPDILASTLASRHPLRVAVLIPFHTEENWFWQEPLSGINDAINELDHFRIEKREFLYDQFRRDDFVSKAGEVLDYSPEAVIAAPVFYKETVEFIAECSRRSISFVSINDNAGHPDQMSYIGQDARQSGQVAAHLIEMGISGDSQILVVSIAKDRDNYRHILHREEGFSNYWKTNNSGYKIEIIKRAIPNDDYSFIEGTMEEIFDTYKSIAGIFVTNSRVYQVAKYLQISGLDKIVLVGYDLINPNINYVNSGIIDFLINQKPREQGYQALNTVFNKLKMNKNPKPERLIPIDIICKENLCCYQD
jgi:LacI family transcriptional regulator